MADNNFWVKPDDIPLDLNLLRLYSNDEDFFSVPGDYSLRVYTIDTMNTNYAFPFFALGDRNSDPQMEDVSGCLEETLHELLDAGATHDDVYRIMGLVQEQEILEEDALDSDQYIPIDLGYCIVGNLASYEAVPEDVADIGGRITDKQFVQCEQALDGGCSLHDAMRLATHEYDGFQANAIKKAALSHRIDEKTLDRIADPRFTARKMTILAEIAKDGGDITPFLDTKMDAERTKAAYRVLSHGGEHLPVKDLSLDQLQTINNILLRGHTPKDVLATFAKPEFSSDSMSIIAAAFEGAHFITNTGEKALTKEQIGRILYPSYTPEQQLAMLSVMRGGSPVARLSDETFAKLFSPSTSVDRMHVIAHALNKLGLDAQTVEHFANLPTALSPSQLYVVFDAAADEKVSGEAVKLLTESPQLSTQQMRTLLTEAADGKSTKELASIRDGFAQKAPSKEQAQTLDFQSEARDMASGSSALGDQSDSRDMASQEQGKEVE